MEIALGKANLEAIYDPTPSDGFTHTVQICNNVVGASNKKFYPRQLSGVSGHDFPEGCEVIFSGFKSGFRNIHYMRVHKLSGKCSVAITVSFDFSKWDLPEALGSFVDRFSSAVVHDPMFIAALPSKCDYGFDVECSIPVDDSADIWSTINEAEIKLESLYRKHLVSGLAPTKGHFEETRLHWWIRYVVVPIVCSGTIATVIATFLLK